MHTHICVHKYASEKSNEKLVHRGKTGKVDFFFWRLGSNFLLMTFGPLVTPLNGIYHQTIVGGRSRYLAGPNDKRNFRRPIATNHVRGQISNLQLSFCKIKKARNCAPGTLLALSRKRMIHSHRIVLEKVGRVGGDLPTGLLVETQNPTKKECD